MIASRLYFGRMAPSDFVGCGFIIGFGLWMVLAPNSFTRVQTRLGRRDMSGRDGTRKSGLLWLMVVVPALIYEFRGPVVGDLSLRVSQRVHADSAALFDPTRWRSGDRRLRGQMIADFETNHSLVGRTNEEVLALLGPSECYVDSDHEPCYWVQLGGKAYRMAFNMTRTQRHGVVRNSRLDEEFPPR
jgi:hypothetical protein